MQIKILDKVFECDNQVSAVEAVFEQINQILINTNLKVSCMEIDGVEVYEKYDQYIVTNLEDINTIIVIVKSLAELMDSTLLSVRDYLVNAVPEIEKMVDEFYHDVNQDTWNKFTDLLDGLQFIIDTLDVVSNHRDWYGKAEQFALVKQNLLKQIGMLQTAMESQDRVRIIDVLLYEIISSFKALINQIDLNIPSGQQH